MKKLLKSALAIIFAIILTFCFVGCQGNSFLTQSQIDKLGNKLGLTKDSNQNFINPTATIVLEFENNEDKYVVELVYELLFDKAPLTVNNFIALAKEGFYNDTVASYSNADYTLFGKYELNNESKYAEKETDFTIKGEFGANGWFVNGEDIEDNAKHQLGCLGMYHEEQTKSVNNFDNASAAFYMMWATVYGSDKTISNDNYAVFAYVKSCKITINATQNGFYNGNEFADGMASNFVNFIKSVSTSTKTDVNNNTISKVPTNPIAITSITISGATGSANTAYRK